LRYGIGNIFRTLTCAGNENTFCIVANGASLDWRSMKSLFVGAQIKESGDGFESSRGTMAGESTTISPALS